MCSWVVLGLVVRQVSSSWAPVHAEHLLVFLASHPKEAHVPRLDLLVLHVFVTCTVPCAVELSVWMGVLPCRWPISIRVFRAGMASLAAKKIAPISASAALDITVLIRLAVLSTAPLFAGIGTSLARENVRATRFRFA